MLDSVFLIVVMAVSLGLTKLLILSYVVMAAVDITTTAEPLKLVTKLIHHNAASSLYYNPISTIADRTRYALKSSITRYKYLSRKVEGSHFIIDDVRAGIIADDLSVGFLVNVSIGMPPVPQLLIMDTGSNLLWLQCMPCNGCLNQSLPLFDPSKSSTFKKLPCSEPNCQAAPQGACDAQQNCTYSYTYVDGITTTGDIATEELIVETSNEGTVIIPGVLIGCGHHNKGQGDGQQTGIFGLGPKTITLPHQVGSVFSYCIGSIDNPHYAFNQLILGISTKGIGNPTPLQIYRDAYFLTLDAIHIGEKKLQIDPSVFRRTPEGKGGLVIDSGSTYTWLVREAFVAVSDEVKLLMSGHHMDQVVFDPVTPEMLCFKGNVSGDLEWFPMVTFSFAQGANMELDIYSMFIQLREDMVCMTLLDAGSLGLSIIGVTAQQNHNVAYDLVNYKLYLKRVDCETL